jgi:multicomponent Na+:H+ antiporter subunit F
MIFAAGLAACGVALILALVRAMRGPTPFDRLLAVNAIGTTVILGIALHGYALGRPEFVDISILYAVINFIGTFAVLKLFNTGGLGDTGGRAKPDLDSVMADGQVRNSKQTETKSGGRS